MRHNNSNTIFAAKKKSKEGVGGKFSIRVRLGKVFFFALLAAKNLDAFFCGYCASLWLQTRLAFVAAVILAWRQFWSVVANFPAISAQSVQHLRPAGVIPVECLPQIS
jgi:hypothetical protein